MGADPQDGHHGGTNEAEFEASLVCDVDADLVGAETEVVEVKAASSKPAPTSGQPGWVGKVLGHFKLLRLIGEGKMGRVIQAQDINLRRMAALKVLCKRLVGVDERGRVEQFLREARAAAQIEHPNVVHVYEINQHDGWWYIAMELLDAGNLRQVVNAAGPLSIPRACSLIADAATGLAAAHQLGIVHRDIKPANLMLTRSGRCKLTDFGLVRLDDPNDPFDFTQKAVGSPAFMAPEIILNKEQTAAIDVYSLGAALFFALTGKMVYTGRNVKEVLRKHVRDAIPDIRTFLPECPDSLAAITARALAKDPADRPSASDLAAALRAEAITTQIDDSGSVGSAGASLVQSLTTSTVSAPQAAPPGAWARVRATVTARPRTALAVALVIVAGATLMGVHGAARWWAGRRGPRPAALSGLFPGAPKSYGVLPPATVLKPIRIDSEAPPAFSWVHNVEAEDFKFVARKDGRQFYAVDSPEAILIPAQNFAGYKTIEDARADGKVAVP